MPVSTESTSKKNNIAPVIALGVAAIGAVAASCVLAFKNKNLNKAVVNLQDMVQDLQQANAKQFQHLLFPSGLDKLHLQQQNVGDCYLLSSLYALSRNKKGRDAIRKMISLNANGDFEVMINKQLITIKPTELLGQMTTQSGKQVFARSVNSDPGIKIIERAYARYEKQFGKLSGGTTRPKNVSMITVNGGFGNQTIEALVGFQKANSIGLFGQDTLSRQGLQGHNIASILQSLPQSDHIFIARTGPQNPGGRKYMDAAHRFIRKHAYAIDSVDFSNGTIKVVNPHDTMHKVYDITFDEFSKYFSEISVNKVV